ncbi:hypothetical protein [Novispirillum itersonii]|uniref:Uncharacterized protein n=1 Tax=Novispirillum itersonii TaxID=189 RepID=A0A7W9ZCB6_NOVIT|nr:hypothetical protein [Novispirillum itersonii]MBB6208806.1 hypothetical protein [Novispirillum itersonii]
MHAVLTSLHAFLSAAIRPRTPLARGITVALCIKLVVVVSMRLFLFGADARVPVDDSAMTGRLIETGAVEKGN